jgi:tRNA nucleotidyltransferase (CCA-adding enzyme)
MNHLQYIQSLYTQYPLLKQIISSISNAGFKSVLVGGSVRDYLLKIPLENTIDHDIEVYGCSLEQLQEILLQFGVVRLVGKSFGVLMLDRLPVDWSIPRSDSVGRKPLVSFDPQLSYKSAFARRDLTINAMGIDCVSGDLIDPYNGNSDLENKVARSPNLSLFGDDPLRFFRLVHFISRFELSVDCELEQYCKQMVLGMLASARIGQEMKKLLLLSKQPSKGLRWLASINRLSDVSPELAQLASVLQGVKWHPEGDVLEHSLQALDAMARCAALWPEQKRLTLLYAALFHDVGKKEATVILSDRISSHGHAQKGAQKIASILKRFDVSQSISDGVKSLIFYHMHPGQFIRTGAHVKAYKWLAYELHNLVCMTDLADLFLADLQGRNPEKTVPLSCPMDEVDQFLAIITSLGIAHEPEKPLVKAADFIDSVQGKKLGDLLEKAYELQINQSISDSDVLKEMIRKMISKNSLLQQN